MDERLEDAVAVLDAVGCEHTVPLGLSFLGHVAIDFAARRPDRTNALVLCNARARWIWAEDYPDGFPADFYENVTLRVVDPDGAEPPPFDPMPSASGDPAFARWWERAGHRRASPAMARAVIDERMRLDMRSALPEITAPTLIIQRTEIEMLPVGHGRYLADHIPGARLVEVPGIDLVWWVGDFHPIAEAIESFLGVGRARTGRRRLATVLFVDVVSSTEQAAHLGDSRWRDLLGAYHAAVQGEIDRNGGRRISTAGDGFLALFDMPTDAVHCAAGIIGAVRGLGISIRAGVHTGEVEVMGDDVAGIGVHIAARVQSAAAPGEVWVSSTVRDLVTGSGLTFDPRGEHDLKGVPGAWALHALKS